MLLQYLKSQSPNRNAVVYGDECLSYGELVNYLDKHRYQLCQTDLVCIASNSLLDQLLQFLVITNCGGVAIIDTGAGLESISGYNLNKFKVVQFDELVDDSSADTKSNNEQNPIILAAKTSGSTGKPKILFKRLASWLSAFPHQSTLFNCSTQSSVLISGSLGFTANLNFVLHMLWLGGQVVLTDSMNPKQWLNLITEYQLSHAFLVPAKLRLLTRVAPPEYNVPFTIVTAGENLSVNVLNHLVQNWPNANLIQYYGASELSFVTTIDLKSMLQRTGSVGKAFPGVDIQVDANSKIQITSPYGAIGFEARATAGDYGYLDKDDYLYLKGRQDDQINIKGRKVSLSEIEARLAEILEDTEFSVLPLINNEALTGYELFVMTDSTVKSIENKINIPIKGLLKPARILVVDNLPRTISGKVDLHQLKQISKSASEA